MLFNYYFWHFIGVTACFITGITAREAIVGGRIAKKHEFPYIVSVQIGGQHICGGTIIHDEFVLTAAGCLDVHNTNQPKNSRFYILTGTNNLLDRDYPAVTVEVINVMKTDSFKPSEGNFIGNIAVLQLKNSLRLKHRTNLMKIDLPNHTTEIRPGEIAKIAGFGWNNVTENKQMKVRFHGHSDNQLYFAEAAVLNDTICREMLLEHRKISKQEFCAQVKQHHPGYLYGVCNGDIGSPLVDDNGSIIGILSAGPDSCSEKNNPGIYIRISPYVHFINFAIKQRESSTSNPSKDQKAS